MELSRIELGEAPPPRSVPIGDVVAEGASSASGRLAEARGIEIAVLDAHTRASGSSATAASWSRRSATSSRTP